MPSPDTRMRLEILEIPEAVERLLSEGAGNIRAAARAVAAVAPRHGLTVARGSSDHACTYLAYACELLLGIPVASIGPSIASIYHAPLKLERSLCIAVSQSGRSPDIVEMARAARRDGALSVAITNDPGSPLAMACEHALAIHAGPEMSVAATKTFVTSVVAGLWLLAEWKGDDALREAIFELPRALERATGIDWPEVREAIGPATSLYTLGRGPTSAISNEAALKFKETCQLHAESYSSAEVLHGPVAIVEAGFPVICLSAADAAEGALTAIADEIAGKGAKVFVTSSRARAATTIEHVRTRHPLTDPLGLIVSFYAMVERFAAARGINPDAPRYLNKVTRTL